MTGSERARQARKVREISFRNRINALDLAFCANCPSCTDTGTISREQIVERLGCTLGEASRAIADLQQSAFLGSARRASFSRGRDHRPGGRKLYPVLAFRGCRTYDEALRARDARERKPR